MKKNVIQENSLCNESGLKKMALSTIKGQISVLTILQRLLVTHVLIRTFIQGVSHVAPLLDPMCFCGIWIWFIVNSENIIWTYQGIFSFHTHKVVFLITITAGHSVSKRIALSCKEFFSGLTQEQSGIKALHLLHSQGGFNFSPGHCASIPLSGFSRVKKEFLSLSGLRIFVYLAVTPLLERPTLFVILDGPYEGNHLLFFQWPRQFIILWLWS